MEWPTTIIQTVLFYITLPLNIAHMFLYFSPKKGRPGLMILGLGLTPLPLALPRMTGQVLPPELNMGLLILISLLFSAAVFRLFVFEGGFGRILFGVLSVSTFNNMMTILIYAVLFQGLGLPADQYTYLLTRVIYAGACLALFPVLYRRARRPFIRILDAVEHSAWYVNSLSPLMLTFLGYFAGLILFRHPEPLVAAVGVMLAAAMAGLYILVYNVIIGRDLNALLSSQLDFTGRLLTIYDHYDDLLGQKEQSLRLMRHDFRHHLGRLDALALNRDYEALRRCIAEIADSSADFELGVYSDDRVVNAVVSYHFAEAAKHGVDCSALIKIDEELPLSETELAVLLGNALENCAKAASPLGPAGRISLAVRPVRDRMVFKFENNYLDEIYRQGQGLGLRSIRQICLRHGGMMETRRADGEFQLTVIFPLNHKTLRLNTIGENP